VFLTLTLTSGPAFSTRSCLVLYSRYTTFSVFFVFLVLRCPVLQTQSTRPLLMTKNVRRKPVIKVSSQRSCLELCGLVFRPLVRRSWLGKFELTGWTEGREWIYVLCAYSVQKCSALFTIPIRWFLLLTVGVVVSVLLMVLWFNSPHSKELLCTTTSWCYDSCLCFNAQSSNTMYHCQLPSVL